VNICVKVDPYYQQQKCSPVTLLSGSMWISQGFLGEGAANDWGCQQWQFSVFSLAISLETLEIRPALLYRLAIHHPKSAFQ